MTVPGRTDAARLLLTLDPPPWLLRHSRAVAEVAAWLAARVEQRGLEVNRPVAESGALLHDVDKAISDSDPARHLPHGLGSAAWLARQGLDEVASVVVDHPVTRLADARWFDRWLAETSLEARIVAYADKRAGQRLESLADRFASWERRYPPERGGWTPETRAAIRRRAERLEADVCGAAGIGPEDVRRLRWTRAPLMTARLGRAA